MHDMGIRGVGQTYPSEQCKMLEAGVEVRFLLKVDNFLKM
jgi:hypothetical protein